MITLKIGSSERRLQDLRDVDESWVSEQINRRREDGESVCVRVTIQEGSSVNIGLSTPNCGGSGGVARPLTSEEQAISDLWDKRGLNSSDFSVGNVIAFLKQLRRITN